MQIKEAAALCGLTEKAIRLYEEKGLITPQYTEINGRKFRDYDAQTIEQLKVIAGLRQSFFSIEQIAAMQNTPEDIPAIFSDYRDELREKFRALEVLLERADAVDAAALSSADALAAALDTTLPAPEEIPTLPTDEPYRIRRTETHAVPEMRFRVWDEDIGRDAREAAYKRYLAYAKQWEHSYDTELKIDKLKHFWRYPVGRFVVLPLLCLAIIGCFLYFFGWTTKIDVTYTGYEITFADDVWNEIGAKLNDLPDEVVPHEMDVSDFPQVVEAKETETRFWGKHIRYLFKPDCFEGYILPIEFGFYERFNGTWSDKWIIYKMALPGTLLPQSPGIYYPCRTDDRAMLMNTYLTENFGDEDGYVIFPLMEPYQNTLTGDEGYRSTNTYIVLGADSPEEASHIFWDRLWRSWQEDIYKVDPDYFRETMTE